MGLDWLGPLVAPKGKRDESIARASLTAGGAAEALAPSAGSKYEDELEATRAEVLRDQSKSDQELGISSAPAPVPSRAAVAGVAPPPQAPAQPRTVTRADPNVALPTVKGAANNDKTPQKPPPPSAPSSDKMEGTGPALSGVAAATAAGGLPGGIPWRIPGSPGYEESRRDLPTVTKMPDGRMVTTPETEARGVKVDTAAGWDAKAEAKRFMEGRTRKPAEGSAGPAKGTWTFSGGIGTGKAREGTGTLSGTEQLVSRNAFLERNRRERQMDELENLNFDVQRAKADYAMRAMNLDPYEMARIQARGRYGGKEIEVGAEAASREAALAQFDSRMREILALTTDPNERKRLMEMAAFATAEILLGQGPKNPSAQNALAGMLMTMGMGGAGAATAGKIEK